MDLDEGHEAVLVFSLPGTTGPPAAVRHTHASIGRATTDWCTALGLGPETWFQVATPPSHILGLLNLLAAVEAGATVRLHRRFDLDAVLDHIESDCMTLEDGGWRPSPSHWPTTPDSRTGPLFAPLHHVGGHAGDRERRPDRHRVTGSGGCQPTGPAK